MMPEKQPCDKKRRLMSSEIVPSGTPNKIGTILRKSSEVQKVELPAFEDLLGNYFDVKAFLSSKDRDYLVSPKDGQRVPISSLDGKYVLMCCFCIPFDMHSMEGSVCHSIQALYSELSRIAIADVVKLVIVAKLDRGFNEDAFNRFFSWLPFNCLAIPFSDSDSRHSICKYLNLHEEKVPSLVVHPDGKVLQDECSFLSSYGSQCFPFTYEHFSRIDQLDGLFERRLCLPHSPETLAKLLQCNKLSQIDDETKSISVSDLLADTPLGLYLYCNGDFIKELRRIHQKCRDKGFKFDIVLVPLPFDRHYDLASFHNLIKESASKDSTSSSWWAFSFNDKVCRTLWRLTHASSKDSLIILPHGDYIGDIHGKQVARKYGVDGYPFTLNAIVERKVSDLRSLTLRSLLGRTFATELQNKNVLLYFDSFTPHGSNIHHIVNEGMTNIKRLYPDSDFVFVPLDPVLSYSDFSKLQCRIVPEEKRESLIKRVFMVGSYPDEFTKCCLVTFGKDGKILSRFADNLLPISSSSAPLFEDKLLSEIHSWSNRDIWCNCFWSNHGIWCNC